MGATYKNNIELTIFGESHGKAIGITIGNLPSGIQIDLDEVARDMKRRAPGQNKMSTARKEADQVEILSGLQDGITTGAPLTGVIYNSDQHSKDYSLLKTNMRPGHSDYPAYIKYKGFNDVRGGGHFSGRITAPIVFAGNIAKQILKQKGIVVGAHILSIGNVKDERFPYNVDETLLSSLSQKQYPTIKEDVFEKMEATILKAREKGLKFVPCTGRAFNMIPDILKEIGTYDQAGEYSLCFNGGLIVENKNNKVLHFKGLEFDKAKEIFDNARDLDVCVLVFTLDCCYIFHADEDEIQRKIAQKAKFEVIDDFDISFLKHEKIAKILYEKRDMDYLKVLALKLPQSIQDTCSIAFSSGRYLEMNTKGVDKGYGMRWLVDYLGYDMDETIGIGDNYNDVEMIKTAKLGCAVACASDDIKELAQYVTKKDYDEGAVSEVIEKFVLGEDHE